jgi:hypothetical protein
MHLRTRDGVNKDEDGRGRDFLFLAIFIFLVIALTPMKTASEMHAKPPLPQNSKRGMQFGQGLDLLCLCECLGRGFLSFIGAAG